MDKQGFAHFMLKEIYEQPDVIQTCLARYLNLDGSLDRPCTLELPSDFYALKEIQVIACGSSWHASLIGQHWLEQLAGIPTRVRSASEFIAAPPPIAANTLTIAVTQSGETADTLAALHTERQRRSIAKLPSNLLGITNQPNSSLAAQVDHILPTLAGTEIGIAATKTFLAQLIVFYCLALDLAAQRQTIPALQWQQTMTQLQALPRQIAAFLQPSLIAPLTQTLAAAEHCIILGRGINHAIALEAALKLKETTYLHAEGYAAGEFMHGPIALLDPQIPVIVLAPAGPSYSAMLTNTRKVRANGAPLLGLIAADADAETSRLFDQTIAVPAIDESLSPFLTILPLQLLAYQLAVLRGLDVDRPRNITKTIRDEPHFQQ